MGLTGGAGAGVLIAHPEWVKIQSIQIDLADSSDQHLLFQRIRSSLLPQLRHFEGKYFWQVSLATVMELAIKDRRVKSASLFREFPSRLRLEILPHTPVLGYLGSDGRVYPVARDATLLPPQSHHDAPDLPFLRGEDLKDEPGLREMALELFAAIPDSGPLQKASVSEIIYARKEGFKIFVTGAKAEIKMGDQDFGPRVSRVNKVLSYLESRNVRGRVIDARFSKKVVVRVRNTP